MRKLIIKFLKCECITLNIKLKSIELQLLKAKNRDIEHLQDVAFDILGRKKSIIEPLTLLYISRNSSLYVGRINLLNETIDITNRDVANMVMNLADKGCSDRMIIKEVRFYYT